MSTIQIRTIGKYVLVKIITLYSMLLDSEPFCAQQKMSPIFLTRFDRACFLISFRHLSSV